MILFYDKYAAEISLSADYKNHTCVCDCLKRHFSLNQNLVVDVV